MTFSALQAFFTRVYNDFPPIKVNRFPARREFGLVFDQEERERRLKKKVAEVRKIFETWKNLKKNGRKDPFRRDRTAQNASGHLGRPPSPHHPRKIEKKGRKSRGNGVSPDFFFRIRLMLSFVLDREAEEGSGK